MDIRASARTHGVSDEDMLHAVRRPMRIIDRDDDTTLYIGPATSGDLLEVVVIGMSDQTAARPRIIHAMKL